MAVAATQLRFGLCVALLLQGCEESQAPTPRDGCAFVDHEGGSLSSEDGALTISLRPGALAEGDEIELCIESTDEPPDVTSTAYRVRPDIQLEVEASVTFTDTLSDDSGVPAVVSIAREAFEDGEGRWQRLPTTRIDQSAGLIAATDPELSMFYGVLVSTDAE